MAALGNSALRVCSAHTSDAKKMIEALDNRFDSTCAATRFSVLTAVYSKRFSNIHNITRYIDEFES